MIPFDRFYSWLFKSFNISGETKLMERLISEGYIEAMIVKRSWIFGLYMLWMPGLMLILSGMSIWIALDSIAIEAIKYTLITGNILMSMILSFSSLNYIRYFKKIHHQPTITKISELQEELHQGDIYFKNFFNWSVTNQFILFITIIIEIILMVQYGNRLGDHFWILSGDIIVILVEIWILRKYRKKMMDLEMDYNIVVPGKVFFVNQSGLLSTVQTIEGDKIKTVQSLFPNKIASFFSYGTVHILTEGDSQEMMGTMSMYYVTDPEAVVASIQSLIERREPNEKRSHEFHQHPGIQESNTHKTNISANISTQNPQTPIHSRDTREKIRDVLR